MIIGIGSENPVKVKACKVAIQKLRKKLDVKIEPHFIIRHAASGISHMPTSEAEMMLGAKNRAENLHHTLQSESQSADYTIGLEGGLMNPFPNMRTKPVYFLQSWVYVYDGRSGFWGSSGAIPVPGNITASVINDGLELSTVIDAISGQDDVRSKMGAAGILTDGIVNRQKFFETAIEFAFAPFYNKKYYW